MSSEQPRMVNVPSNGQFYGNENASNPAQPPYAQPRVTRYGQWERVWRDTTTFDGPKKWALANIKWWYEVNGEPWTKDTARMWNATWEQNHGFAQP